MSNSGRFRMINGELVRVGDARAIPDEPWSNKDLDWNNGIKNPATGQIFKNKGDYLDSVKRIGGTVMGNDAPVSQQNKEIRGDFNVREDIKKATQQVLSKQ